MDDIKSKIDNLIAKIEQWNYEYYALDNPSVSDAEYDKHMQLLIQLEKEYPQYKRPDSPTARVGGVVLDKFNKIKHLRPMLSLDNIFDYDGVKKFCDNVYKSINQPCSYVVEPKIDGLSISIVYENCKLKYACTRGDGEYGEDVTANIMTISEVPLYINSQYQDMHVEVRGEVYMSIATLKELNSKQEKKFANCRNAAAGAVRNLDSSVAKSRRLQAFFYYVFIDKKNLETHNETLNWLKQNNFPVSDIIKSVNNEEEIWNHIEYISTKRSSLNYEIDGVVIKVNENKFYEDIGYTSKFPKWAIAYKFPATIVETKLLSIEPTVGRTGKITYVANLQPVYLDGSTISAASLHNRDFINDKDIRINDYVKIFKAGDVIPYVEGVNLTKRDATCIKYNPIKQCPSCQSILVDSEDGIDQFCVNDDCEQKILHKIEYFCSRDIMNIEGVSYSIIKKLYEHQIIRSFIDLYNLHNKKTAIFDADINIKEKSFLNIINAVETSKNNSLERLIASFAIKGVGITIATILAKKYKNIDNLINAPLSELTELNIVGEKIANNIFDFFHNEKNLQMINDLKALGLNMNYISKVDAGNFKRYYDFAAQDANQQYHNKTFVITGSFDQSRNEIKLILEECYGAKVVGTVTKNVNYLIVGANGGSKLQKANDLKIPTIENEFWLGK